MRRREVFGLVLLATIRCAQAQGLSKVFRIGVVSPINLALPHSFWRLRIVCAKSDTLKAEI